jgi:hypothetical protein
MDKMTMKDLADMYKKLMAGEDVKAVTAEEKKAKAQVLKDIAFAKKRGFQIDFPND